MIGHAVADAIGDSSSSAIGNVCGPCGAPRRADDRRLDGLRALRKNRRPATVRCRVVCCPTLRLSDDDRQRQAVGKVRLALAPVALGDVHGGLAHVRRPGTGDVS